MRFEFVKPALTCTLGRNVAPPSVLAVTKYCAWSLAAPALRASNQPTARLPVVWSTASPGKNCELPLASSLTWTGALQVAPLSDEVRTKMLRSSDVVLGASV